MIPYGHLAITVCRAPYTTIILGFLGCLWGILWGCDQWCSCLGFRNFIWWHIIQNSNICELWLTVAVVGPGRLYGVWYFKVAELISVSKLHACQNVTWVDSVLNGVIWFCVKPGKLKLFSTVQFLLLCLYSSFGETPRLKYWLYLPDSESVFFLENGGYYLLFHRSKLPLIQIISLGLIWLTYLVTLLRFLDH